MQAPFSRIALLTALCVAQTFAAPVDSSQRETIDFGWKFDRYGKMPDGTMRPEPGNSDSRIYADSEENGNPASNAIDGDNSTRWCASNNQAGHYLVLDMGKAVAPKTLDIAWEKQADHQYKIEGSADNKSWTTIAQVNQSNDSKEDTAKLSGNFRYYKITVNGNTGNNWASIRELVFKDQKGQKITPLAPSSDKANSRPEAPSFNDSTWRSLDLPHDWGIEGPFRMELENETGKLPWVGIGWYRKVLPIPSADEGNRFYLDFDGVMSRPKIYVNGELAGEWKYGYGSFRVDITPFLKVGKKNLIAVRVDNPPNSSRWYPGGGIYRHVWLTKSNPIHIDNWGVFVKTPKVSKSEAQVVVDATVLNNTSKSVTPVVTEEIVRSGEVVASKTTNGKPIAAGESATVTSKLQVKNPALWDTQSPHMYTMRTTITIDGKQVDQKETAFGIRSIEWKPDGFYLNGNKTYLKGVCQHADLGPLGTAVNTRGYERQIQILKDFGVNSIRTTHNPPAPEMLELCDKNGILVIAELFDMWKNAKKGQDYHNYYEEWHERDLVNFVHRDRNHPSIIIWSSGNEVPEQGISNDFDVSQNLTDLFHREDPTRLVTAGCNNAGAARNGFGDTLDVYGYNYKPNDYNDFSKDRPNQPFYASETASCVSTRGEYFFPVPKDWNKGQGAYMYQVSSYDLFAPGWAYRPDVEFAAQEDAPNVAGEYVWTGFDYLGEPTPYNLDATNALNVPAGPEREKIMAELSKLGDKAPSRSSYFGIVDLCGFKKDRFYNYQAHWRPELPMAHILPHWNWPDRKGEVTPVHVYTSGDEAELFLNGKSLGVRKKNKDKIDGQEKNRFRLVWEDVVYEPGELKVVAKKDGKEWATDVVRTSGPAAKITLKPDRKTIVGDARDLSYVTIAIRDQNDIFVPNAKNDLAIKISGPAEIVAICNGDPTDFTTMNNTSKADVVRIKAFNGLAQVIVRAKRGEQGTVTLETKSSGLKGAKTTINVQEATPEQLKN